MVEVAGNFQVFILTGRYPTSICINHLIGTRVGLTATTASPMAVNGRSHSIFLKMAMGAEF